MKKKLLAFFMGIFLLAILAELSLQLSSYFHQRQITQQFSKKKQVINKNQFRILCLGDSMTSLGGKPAYPEQLENLLAHKFPSMNFNVVNMGIPGTNTGILLSHLSQYLDQFQPDLVISMIGNSDELLSPQLINTKKNGKVLNFLNEKVKLVKLIQLLGIHLSFKWHEVAFYWKNFFHQRNLQQRNHDKNKSFQKSINSPGKSGALTSYHKELTLEKELLKIFQDDASMENALKLGQLYFENLIYDRAKEYYLFVLKKDLHHALAYQRLGRIAFIQGKVEQAEKDLRLSLALDSHNETSYLYLIELLYLKKDFPQAKQLIGQAVTHLNDAPNVYLWLNEIYRRDGSFKNNEREYLHLVQIHPSEGAFIYLGRFYELTGHIRQAEKTYLKALEKNPHSYYAQYLLADVYKNLGQKEKAITLLQKCLELSPQLPMAYFSLGTLYAEAGQGHLAKPYLEVAAKVDSLFNLGHKKYFAFQLEKMGQKEMAQKLLNGISQIRWQQYNPDTIENYRQIALQVQSRHIPLLAMQYPNRDLFILQKFLRGIEGVEFIGNEENFKQAMLKEGMAKIFVDNFAGDLGHLSQRGHQLVAENLYQYILSNLFIFKNKHGKLVQHN